LQVAVAVQADLVEAVVRVVSVLELRFQQLQLHTQLLLVLVALELLIVTHTLMLLEVLIRYLAQLPQLAAAVVMVQTRAQLHRVRVVQAVAVAK